MSKRKAAYQFALLMSLLICVAVLVESLWTFGSGAYPVWEHGKLSHGLLNRTVVLPLLTYTLLIGLAGRRLGRPSILFVPVFLVAFGLIGLSSLIVSEGIWKGDGSSPGPIFLAFVALLIVPIIGFSNHRIGGGDKH